VSKIKEVLRLRFLNNLSYRQVEVLSGASKSSVSEYCLRFEIIPHTIKAALALCDEELDELLHPEKKLRLRNSERPLPDMNYIYSELKRKGVTLQLLWQEYREIHLNGYSYTQFGEHYRRYASTINPSMRQIHYAGDKLFVDYSGGTVPIVDPITGEISRAQIFVCVLGASGYTFVHASPSQSTADFIDSHNRAFRFYGGVPNILVPDNLKAAVISHKKGAIKLNDEWLSDVLGETK
jgi:transposase